MAISNKGLIVIKLTNQNEKFLNEPIWINPDQILTILTPPKDNNPDKITIVYSVSKESWTVGETPEEILELIKKSKSKTK